MAAPKGNCFNPDGRPLKPIDWKQFEKLCAMLCTQSEISSWFGLCEDSLLHRVRLNYKEEYSVVYKRYSDQGRCSLRRTQLKLAEKSASMAIFLGKQKNWLGQTDTPIEDVVTDVLTKKFDAVMDQVRLAQSSSANTSSNLSTIDKS